MVVPWLSLFLWNTNFIKNGNSQFSFCPNERGVFYATSPGCQIYYRCQNRMLMSGLCYPWQRFDVHTLRCKQLGEVDCNPEYVGIWRPVYESKPLIVEHRPSEDTTGKEKVLGGRSEGMPVEETTGEEKVPGGSSEGMPVEETTREEEVLGGSSEGSPVAETTGPEEVLGGSSEGMTEEETTGGEKEVLGGSSEGTPVETDEPDGKQGEDSSKELEPSEPVGQEEMKETRTEEEREKEVEAILENGPVEESGLTDKEGSNENEDIEESTISGGEETTTQIEGIERNEEEKGPNQLVSIIDEVEALISRIDNATKEENLNGENDQVRHTEGITGENIERSLQKTKRTAQAFPDDPSTMLQPCDLISTSIESGQQSTPPSFSWFWCGSGRYVIAQSSEDANRICLELRDPEFIDEEGTAQQGGDWAGHTFLGANIDTDLHS